MAQHTNGYQLFAIAENFLTDLSPEDESIISGGGGKTNGCGGSKKNSKKKSKSKSCGCGGYC
jgi:hypothetical protein